MERTAKKCKQCGREIYFDGICVSCQTENERNRILALSQEEIDASIQQICNEIEKTGDLDQESDLFKQLLDYRDINTSKIAKAAFEKNLFNPCELYKDAPDYIIESMMDILKKDSADPQLAGALLLCLAVCGGEKVYQLFLDLERHPRSWRKKLYVNPSFYATYGGWSYDSNGRFMKTNFDKCYPMALGTLEEKKRSPVKIGVKTGEKCSQCGLGLVNLMEIDGTDPRLDFLELNGVVKAKCCPNCMIYSDNYFCRYTLDGESEIILEKDAVMMEDELKDAGLEELTSNSYILGDQPVALRYAADWEGGSSVGGFAFWIQDCDIRLCPDCGKPMKYLAQIQWDTVLSGMEGNAYIEICPDCNMIAMLHQQT